jgi:hypothetical protein
MDKYMDDNDKRAKEIESFMIAEGEKIGVVKISITRKYKNPNRWNKQLTPWFTETCQETRS